MNVTHCGPELKQEVTSERLRSSVGERPDRAQTGFGLARHSMGIARIVTTSWDDGDRVDLKLAELLRPRGIRGTFYVPIRACRERSLDRAEMRALLSEGFEIGAHGFSHRLLSGLPAEKLAMEISPCKSILEDTLGTKVRTFCYPRGRYDSNVVRALKEAGYCGARTVRMLATRPDFHPFEMPTTVQVFPHSRSSYLRNAVRGRKLEGLQVCVTQQARLGNWVDLGKRLFDSVLQKGGVWHLYGHSWEIDALGLWDGLRAILDYVCCREGIIYLTNSEVLKFMQARAEAGEHEPVESYT